MRKILYIFIVATFLAVFFGFSNSQAYDTNDTGWEIDKFNSDVVINEDRSATVKEDIDVNFNNLNKHGIYRYIPYKYSRNGNNYDVRIDVKSVTDQDGNSVSYEESRSSGNLELKIGDADKLISGSQHYTIEYFINRVINSFSDHDEFYWNATGNDWPVDIKEANIKITWPQNAEMFDNNCFTGSYGSNTSNCQIDVQDNSVNLSIRDVLTPGEGFTVVSGIKPGVIKQYSVWTQIEWFLQDNWGYLVPFLVLILLINNYYKKGKDPRDMKKTVVPEFAPPEKLSPAVMGTIYDEKVDTHDISAVIIDMAVRGYIKIKELEEKKILGIGSGKDYLLTDTKKIRNGLANYEMKIMDGLFKEDSLVKISELRNKFYIYIKDIKKDLYDTVKKDGYFEENPENVRNKYLAFGVVVLILGFFLPEFLVFFMGSFFPIMFAFVGSGILIIIFSFLMPKRTDKGVEITRQIKGFKLYMYTAERYRQKFNEDNKIFEKFLPYAMIFGIVKEWSKKFEKMQIDRPDWYEGRGAFYPVVFASSMSDMQTSMNSALISAPSSAGSGGSGFSGGGSGGGFGGGGGGSW